MTIIIAPDSFKDCLSAVDVCNAVSDGIHDILPNSKLTSIPMSDGGEGLISAVHGATGGQLIELTVKDPLSRDVAASYLFQAKTNTAVIESAVACGLERLSDDERNPCNTSTFGVGQLMLDAVNRGAKRILIGIGGSSTTDGGTGMARALGFAFRNAEGNDLPDNGIGLLDLDSIEFPKNNPCANVRIEVACDVNNPLLGEYGSAQIFGPQKGASPDDVIKLDDALAQLDKTMQSHFNIHIADFPGVGAAGGLGYGLKAFCNAKLDMGFKLVSDIVDLETHLDDADLVITGEGQTDFQTAAGKVCSGIAKEAKKREIPCIILSGALSGPMDVLNELGITAAFSISKGPGSLQDAIGDAEENLRLTAQQIARLIHQYRKG